MKGGVNAHKQKRARCKGGVFPVKHQVIILAGLYISHRRNPLLQNYWFLSIALLGENKAWQQITNEMIYSLYDFSKQVYESALPQKDALDSLEFTYQMNRSSAANYFHNYTCMIKGNIFPRTGNSYGTDCFLKKTLKDRLQEKTAGY